MRKLRLFYQNNKEKIWKILGISLLIFVLIRLANYYIKTNNDEMVQNNIITNNNISYNPSQSVISDSNISDKDTDENADILDNFVEYCNNGLIDEAYSLVSNACKEEMFNTVEDFYNNYYKDIFTEKKSYDAEVWGTYNGVVTYRVKLLKDIMSAGKIQEEFIEDYYSIVREDGEKKLNLKNFVTKLELENSKSTEDIDINLISKKVYIDYEIIKFNVKNNSGKRVVLDTKEDTETIFIKDTNGVRYPWYGHEIANNLLEIESGQSRELEVKFNKIYNPNRKDNSINFEDIYVEGEDGISIEIGIQ